MPARAYLSLQACRGRYQGPLRLRRPRRCTRRRAQSPGMPPQRPTQEGAPAWPLLSQPVWAARARRRTTAPPRPGHAVRAAAAAKRGPPPWQAELPGREPHPPPVGLQPPHKYLVRLPRQACAVPRARAGVRRPAGLGGRQPEAQQPAARGRRRHRAGGAGVKAQCGPAGRIGAPSYAPAGPGPALRPPALRADIKDHVEVAEGNGGLTKVVLKHACGSQAEARGPRTGSRARRRPRRAAAPACLTPSRARAGLPVRRRDHVLDAAERRRGALHPAGRQVRRRQAHQRRRAALLPPGAPRRPARPRWRRSRAAAPPDAAPRARAQFGPGAMQQHGFARNLPWAIASTSADLQPDERDPTVELVLTDNDYTRAMWCVFKSRARPAARRRRRLTGVYACGAPGRTRSRPCSQ